MQFITTALALLGLTTSTFANPLPFKNMKRDVFGPVITSDFPDPGILKVGDTWYAFGTQSRFDHTDIRVQFATSPDFTTWTLHEGHDALGSLPAWVDASNPAIWAPDVVELDDGTFILYYSGYTTSDGAKPGQTHCTGAATSSNIEGPYTPTSDIPLFCPVSEGGAIDASGFRDADGTRYITYKIDGNSIGNGGVCNNEVKPQVPTPIYLQQVEQDGHTLVGDKFKLLDRDERDGPLIEGPSLVRYPGGVYVLHFSSQCYTTEYYSSSYAVSNGGIKGQYEKARFPLLVSGTPANVWGPGHADVDWNTQNIAFHGYAAKEDVGARRQMYVGRLSWDGEAQTISLGI